MTTFTKVSDEETPIIHVDADRKISKIDRMIYGGFTEHMGRCIYGGIYDPKSPLADANGFRTDVIEALREIDVPVIRYPGGNFVATYHWQDGVGPRDKRPRRPELAWLGVETNEFGTDEFMTWLDLLSKGRERRVEPYLCLNMGTGTLDEALAWVEYCNGTGDTHYANMRRKNGHPEPYKVKYWALGNEVWGPWQIEQMTQKDYAKKAIQWSKALRLLDPSIKLILCGKTGISSWDQYVLNECVGAVDMHSIHIYTAAASHLANAVAPLSAERAILATAGMIEVARVEKDVSPDAPPTRICFDEWNVWDPERAPGEQGAEEKYTLSDALAVGVWLNVFVRQSRWVGMANLAQSVNVISPLTTSAAGLLRHTTWWPLLLFARHVRGWTLGCHVRCGSYGGETRPAWLRGALEDGAPWLDVSASVDGDGWVSLAVVNIHETASFETEVRGAGAKVDVYTVTGESADVVNTEGNEVVGIKESSWDGKGKFSFPRLSLTMLRWKSG
ncbi:alpha-N-arabinofuranosidase C [Gaeumannomyces tritici R3-111a-1]|uniref:non-reducing end alpha-L-arabinofuranosidase n=1 Tax=Gaeumannomyces tritici (strain R3-111a-1) TaxID=644352 RepID=J3P332_GAET3|nr:alpha-N-arabinofuranosidase C [Gaeumannomyces tritici R3-111a-1]EJT74074.1 alpha-N-arabinofuranosidase C [Gaeumannomyces tritici R3-111a-1]